MNKEHTLPWRFLEGEEMYILQAETATQRPAGAQSFQEILKLITHRAQQKLCSLDFNFFGKDLKHLKNIWVGFENLNVKWTLHLENGSNML